MKSILPVNKSARKTKKISCRLLKLNVGNLTEMKLIAYCDAPFAGFNNEGSQVGYIIFLVGDNYIFISYQSCRIKRIVKSTQAAEALTMVDTLEACTSTENTLLNFFVLKTS